MAKIRWPRKRKNGSWDQAWDSFKVCASCTANTSDCAEIISEYMAQGLRASGDGQATGVALLPVGASASTSTGTRPPLCYASATTSLWCSVTAGPSCATPPLPLPNMNTLAGPGDCDNTSAQASAKDWRHAPVGVCQRKWLLW